MATTIDQERRTGGAAGTDSGGIARIVNIVAGVWLFISAFLWAHSDVSRTNTWIVGVLCTVFAAIALRVPNVRWLNTALSIWLFFSSLFFFHLREGTLWNNIIVALVIFAASLVPGSATQRMGRPPRYATP